MKCFWKSSFISGGFSNRGVLFGPYCVIYGVGALVLIILLGKANKKRYILGNGM